MVDTIKSSVSSMDGWPKAGGCQIVGHRYKYQGDYFPVKNNLIKIYHRIDNLAVFVL